MQISIQKERKKTANAVFNQLCVCLKKRQCVLFSAMSLHKNCLNVRLFINAIAFYSPHVFVEGGLKDFSGVFNLLNKF